MSHPYLFSKYASYRKILDIILAEKSLCLFENNGIMKSQISMS